MKPVHVPRPDCIAEPWYLQQDELALLDQRHDHCRVPRRDGIEIEREVAVPRPGLAETLHLARAEGDADLAEALGDSDFGNLQRMVDASAHEARRLLQQERPCPHTIWTWSNRSGQLARCSGPFIHHSALSSSGSAQSTIWSYQARSSVQ